MYRYQYWHYDLGYSCFAEQLSAPHSFEFDWRPRVPTWEPHCILPRSSRRVYATTTGRLLCVQRWWCQSTPGSLEPTWAAISRRNRSHDVRWRRRTGRRWRPDDWADERNCHQRRRWWVYRHWAFEYLIRYPLSLQSKISPGPRISSFYSIPCFLLSVIPSWIKQADIFLPIWAKITYPSFCVIVGNALVR